MPQDFAAQFLSRGFSLATIYDNVSYQDWACFRINFLGLAPENATSAKLLFH